MSQPIRVLQVFAQMNRHGSESMIMSMYRNIDRSKVQFDFIVHTTDKCDYDEEIESLGGRIYSIPRYTGTNHFLYKKAWHNFLKQHSDYKIIHGHIRSTASIYLKIAKKYGLITIAHSHNTSSGAGFSAIVKNIYQYPIRYIVDYLFACSKSAGTWLFGERACRKDNFFILNNAIDTKKFIYNENKRIEKRKEFQIEDKFVIGHVGRFHTQKNHEFLIDIFKAVHDKNPNTVLLLIGDGECRTKIEQKVKLCQLTRSVLFAGVRTDVEELYQAMDIFVFTSFYEGLGIVVVEAQTAGLHCVVADTVPEEAFITGLIETVSLKESADVWATRILKYSEGYDRLNMQKQIQTARYDIKEMAMWMEQFYIEKG